MTGRFNGGGLIPRVRDCGTVCLIYARGEGKKSGCFLSRAPAMY